VNRDLGAFGILLVPYLWLVQTFWFVCDDAFITFRFSRNLAAGLGPRYNLGDHVPVEGYSNFLWMLIAALCEATGTDVTWWMPMLSVSCGIVLLGLVFWTLRARVGLQTVDATAVSAILACFPPFAVWSTSGLATMPQSLLMFTTFLLLVDRDEDWAPAAAGVSACLLALVRTEGIAWAMVIGGLAVISRYLRGRPIVRPLMTFSGFLAVSYGIYFGWRFSYYESWVANTAAAKVHLQASTLMRGLRYLGLYVTTMHIPILLLAAIPIGLMSRRRTLALTIGAMALGVPAYGVAVSGDYMTYFRILVPGAAFMVVSFGIAARTIQDRYPAARPAWWALGALVAGLGAAPAFDLYLVPETTRSALQVRDKLGFFRTENKQWSAMVNHSRTWREKGEAIAHYAEPGETMVAAAIGNVGYYSDIFLYDRNGLINREVAAQPWNGILRSPGHDKVVDRSFFLKQKPDILDARVAGGPNLSLSIRGILHEIEAAKVKRQYYPELVELPWSRRKQPRYLVALRRGQGPQKTAEGWATYRDTLATLRKAPSATESADEP
jgi:hypothetical protein